MSGDTINAGSIASFTGCNLRRGDTGEGSFWVARLRRTAATILWEKDPAAVQLLLGHSASRVTQRHYVNSFGILSRAAESFPQPAGFMIGGAA